jgi:hypothetical protein
MIANRSIKRSLPLRPRLHYEVKKTDLQCPHHIDFRQQMPMSGSAMKPTVLRAGVTVGLIAGAIAVAVVISRSGTSSHAGLGSAASIATIRIAEHRQPRIDALNKVIPAIEKQLECSSKSSSIPPRKRTT